MVGSFRDAANLGISQLIISATNKVRHAPEQLTAAVPNGCSFTLHPLKVEIIKQYPLDFDAVFYGLVKTIRSTLAQWFCTILHAGLAFQPFQPDFHTSKTALATQGRSSSRSGACCIITEALTSPRNCTFILRTF